MKVHLIIVVIAVLARKGAGDAVLGAFGENCKAAEEWFHKMGARYITMASGLCESHSKDKTPGGEFGTNAKDWDHCWKGMLQATDIAYECPGVLPPKENIISIYEQIRKECWKGSLCDADNRKNMSHCIEKTIGEGFLEKVGPEYVEKNMNDKNCKLIRDWLEGAGGKKLEHHNVNFLKSVDVVAIRKG